mmetsp:Transcript_33943/g.73458  ORF Transcript_33943/g.73458 Transcript_33943/m.73458 type:complete len:275 (+) Transcript_33943:72-896(+)
MVGHNKKKWAGGHGMGGRGCAPSRPSPTRRLSHSVGRLVGSLALHALAEEGRGVEVHLCRQRGHLGHGGLLDHGLLRLEEVVPEARQQVGVLANLVPHHVLLNLLDDYDVLVQNLRDGPVDFVGLQGQRPAVLAALPGGLRLAAVLVLRAPALLRGRVLPLLLLLLLPLRHPLDAKRHVAHRLVGEQRAHLDVPPERGELVRRELLQRDAQLVLLLFRPLRLRHGCWPLRLNCAVVRVRVNSVWGGSPRDERSRALLRVAVRCRAVRCVARPSM